MNVHDVVDARGGALPALLLALDDPDWGLCFYTYSSDHGGLYDAPADADPSTVLRLECWVESGSQYVYTDRDPNSTWAPMLWGEHYNGVEADTELTGSVEEQLAAIRVALHPETYDCDLHPKFRRGAS